MLPGSEEVWVPLVIHAGKTGWYAGLPKKKVLQKYIYSQKARAETKEPGKVLELKTILVSIFVITCNLWERSGSVVEFLTRDRGAAGSSLIGVTRCGP